MTFIKAIRPTPLLEVAGTLRHILQDRDLSVFPASRLEDLPGWDSMRHIALIAELETRCRILFNLDEIDSMETVGDLMRVVSMKRDGD